MKTIRLTNVTIDLPSGPMIEAIGSQVLDTIAQRQAAWAEKRSARPPVLALRTAAERLARALTKYESARQTPGERAALDGLLAAAAGVRAAGLNLKSAEKPPKKES